MQGDIKLIKCFVRYKKGWLKGKNKTKCNSTGQKHLVKCVQQQFKCSTVEHTKCSVFYFILYTLMPYHMYMTFLFFKWTQTKSFRKNKSFEAGNFCDESYDWSWISFAWSTKNKHHWFLHVKHACLSFCLPYLICIRWKKIKCWN